MQTFSKKVGGQIVQAMQLTDDNVSALANWAQAQTVEEMDAITHEAVDALNVKTPDGIKRCSIGSYLVKKGAFFYVVGGQKFESLYTLVSEEPNPPGEVFDNPFDDVPHV